jgi:hypothetical protein
MQEVARFRRTLAEPCPATHVDRCNVELSLEVDIRNNRRRKSC